ncbi:MAG: FMN-binding protein [Thermodesulfobacteriota bacterium]
MSDKVKTLVFAAALCLACSLLLTAASSGLRTFHQANILMDKQKNILKSVGLVQDGESHTAAEITSRFDKNIKALWVNPSGQIVAAEKRGESDLPVYLYLQGEAIAAYILPINTRGLWGRIHGYLAIQSDGETISGFTVYSHSETPGLGGEIEKRWFQKNFVGKKIVDRAGSFVSIAVAKGVVAEKVPAEKQVNYVDGISGATLTGKFLSSGLKEILLEYEPVSINFRKNMISKTLKVSG